LGDAGEAQAAPGEELETDSNVAPASFDEGSETTAAPEVPE
jgi:hypothetical protein